MSDEFPARTPIRELILFCVAHRRQGCVLVGAVGLALLVVTVTRPARAVDQDLEIWTPAYLTISFSDRIQGWYEAQPRFGNNVSQIDQLILRTALGYRFVDHWSFWFGYAWTPSFNPFEVENRIYQQLLYSRDFPIAALTSRTRLEQRWIENASGTAVRFRTLVRAQFPLSDDRRWGLAAQDEIFLNFNSPTDGPQAGFDQNRFFLGVNRRVNEYLAVDAGYQVQVVENDAPGFPNGVNHVILMQFFFNN